MTNLATPCAFCRYDLTAHVHGEHCPECGASASQRRSRHDARRSLTNRITVGYVAAVTPGALMLVTLLVGWIIAHWVIRIPNPGGVQNGVHPALDALLVVFSALMLPALVSIVALPAAPVVAFLEWRRRSRRRLALVLAATLPTLLLVILLFAPLAFDVADWMPD